jgi:hypothetical protein
MLCVLIQLAPLSQPVQLLSLASPLFAALYPRPPPPTPHARNEEGFGAWSLAYERPFNNMSAVIRACIFEN